MTNFPPGTTYYVKSLPVPASGAPVVYRLRSDGAHLDDTSVFSPGRGGWVDTSQIIRMLMGLSDDEWIEITESEALAHVEAWRRWWESGPDSE